MFTVTYERLGEGRCRRFGTVSARRAVPGELREGVDDWIAVGDAGAWWVVRDDRSVLSYLP